MTRKHQLILFLSPSIGIIVAALTVPFIGDASAWSLRESINGVAAWVEDSTKSPEAEKTPSQLLPPSQPQRTVSSRPLNERKFDDPRAALLSKLRYPQSLSAIRSRIGYEDYTRGGNPEYLSGYGSLRLQKDGDLITGYEVKR